MFAKLTGPALRHSLTAASLLIASGAAVADDCKNFGSCRIAVDFIGTYLAQTCDVEVDNQGESGQVTLPTVGADVLQRVGDEAGSVQFPISLRNCPAGRNIEMHFNTSGGDTSDSITGNLENNTGADLSRGVQVRLRNITGTQMRIDDNTSYQEYAIPASGDEVTHYFIASYYAKSNGTVNAGRVQTRSTIDLTYK